MLDGVAGTNWRNRMERAESVYGGTKSLYCKSPGVTRASLNRSQSVYAKPPSPALPVNSYPARGPLQSAQSTYLARNVDLIRTESIYAARPSAIPVNRYNLILIIYFYYPFHLFVFIIILFASFVLAFLFALILLLFYSFDFYFN